MSGKPWFYVINNQRYGPSDETTMQQLVQNRTIDARTQVWQEGMPGWALLQDTSLRAIVPVAPAPMAYPPPPAPMAYQQAPAPMAVPGFYTAESFNQMFMWFWILMAASVPLMFLFIGIFTLIASVVLWYILMYRYWDLIRDGRPRTTPGQAIGFMFIPFFNFYWNFVAFKGLAEDMNRYCYERSIPAPTISVGLAQAYCILNIFNAIPYLDFLTIIPTFVILIILLSNYTKTAATISMWKAANGYR